MLFPFAEPIGCNMDYLHRRSFYGPIYLCADGDSVHHACLAHSPLRPLNFSRNKDQTVERERSYFFDSHGHRRCVVVVGDKPGDAAVSVGVAPDERCLKIGFFDHSHEHPHPDLPPLPPPPPAAAANNGRASGNAGRCDGAVQEKFGFLREANSLVLLESLPAANSAGAFLSSEEEEEERIQGRPGSQGGGEVFVSSTDELGESGEGRQPNTAVSADEMLRAYGDSFDVVACGGHSMDLVADFIRHFVGADLN